MFDGLYKAIDQLRQADVYDAPLADSLRSGLERLQESISNKELVDENGDIIFLRSDTNGKTIQQVTSELCLSGANLLGSELNISSDKSSADQIRRYGLTQAKLADARQAFVQGEAVLLGC